MKTMNIDYNDTAGLCASAFGILLITSTNIVKYTTHTTTVEIIFNEIAVSQDFVATLIH